MEHQTSQVNIPFHATILAGGGPERKARAMKMAQALVCTAPEEQRPCGVCRDCRKVSEGIHPDVIPIERFMEEKDVGVEIKIAPIRTLRSDAFIRPNEAARKVYVIDNAQTMNLNAQNALLKLLEEGPKYAAFLLLCDRAGALLETIRSRCAVIHLEEERRETDPLALEFLGLLSSGDELERCGFLARLELSKPDRQRLEGFLSSLEELLQQAVVEGVTGSFQSNEIRNLTRRHSSAQLLEWAALARRARDMLPFHVSAGHLLGWLGASLSGGSV